MQPETKTASASPAPPTTAEISHETFQTLLEDWLGQQSPEVTAQLTLDYESDVKSIYLAFATQCMEDLEHDLSLVFQHIEPDKEFSQVAKGKLVKRFRAYCLLKTSGSPTLTDSSVTSASGASQKTCSRSARTIHDR